MTERLLLLRGGAVAAYFIENTTSPTALAADQCVAGADATALSLVLLEPSGACFTLVTPDGRANRGVTRFATSAVRERVRIALAFRNSHVEHPYVCAELFAVAFHRPALVTAARWPRFNRPHGFGDFGLDDNGHGSSSSCGGGGGGGSSSRCSVDFSPFLPLCPTHLLSR